MTAENFGHDLERLSARVDDLTASMSQLMTDLEDLAHAVAPLEPLIEPQAAAAPAESPGRGTAVVPIYITVDEWVSDYFLPTFRRATGGELRWCRQWRKHPEAVLRLDSLWRSWETLRKDENLGLVTWLTHYLDPQLQALMVRSGTFGSCSIDRHVD